MMVLAAPSQMRQLIRSEVLGFDGMSDYNCILVNHCNDVAVINLVDDKVMNPERIQVLGEELLSLPQQNSKLLINMNNVKFLSSAAINKLIVFEKRVRTNGGTVLFSNLSPEVQEVFALTNLNSVFEICNGQEEALQSLQAG